MTVATMLVVHLRIRRLETSQLKPGIPRFLTIFLVVGGIELRFRITGLFDWTSVEIQS